MSENTNIIDVTEAEFNDQVIEASAVSYTHLTLPTNREV